MVIKVVPKLVPSFEAMEEHGNKIDLGTSQQVWLGLIGPFILIEDMIMLARHIIESKLLQPILKTIDNDDL
jgi:hypothetical protein